MLFNNLVLVVVLIYLIVSYSQNAPWQWWIPFKRTPKVPQVTFWVDGHPYSTLKDSSVKESRLLDLSEHNGSAVVNPEKIDTHVCYCTVCQEVTWKITGGEQFMSATAFPGNAEVSPPEVR